MNCACPILSDPKRPPAQARPEIGATSGRRIVLSTHPVFRINLLDAGLRDLIEVLAVERGSRMGGDIDCAHGFSARWIEGVEPVARGEPHMLTIERDPMRLVCVWEGAVVTNNFSGCSFHLCILVVR